MDKNRHQEVQKKTDWRERRPFVLCAVVAFVVASAGIAYYNVRVKGSLYLQSDDGDLYLSIARNLLENVHFIQTARSIKAFVVPPGLPAMCTLLLFFTG